MYLDILCKLEKNIVNCECSYDSRFVTYGRRDFLNKEMYSSLKPGNYEQAFYDIVDYLKTDTWISMGEVTSEYNFYDIIKMDEEYKNSGIICRQEQEIILLMIKDLEVFLKDNICYYNEN